MVRSFIAECFGLTESEGAPSSAGGGARGVEVEMVSKGAAADGVEIPTMGVTENPLVSSMRRQANQMPTVGDDDVFAMPPPSSATSRKAKRASTTAQPSPSSPAARALQQRYEDEQADMV